jgi:hypothetical protein
VREGVRHEFREVIGDRWFRDFRPIVRGKQNAAFDNFKNVDLQLWLE